MSSPAGSIGFRPAGTRSGGRKSGTRTRPRRWPPSLGRHFPFPDFERDYEFVALRHPDEYPINEGRLVSNRGIDINIADYESEFEERHVAHSTALHSVVKRRGAYLVGPMARYALNFDRLPASVQALAREADLVRSVKTPFKVSSCGTRTCLRLRGSTAPDRSLRTARHSRGAGRTTGGHGFGCTEAPRASAGTAMTSRPTAASHGAHRAADLAEPAEHRSGSCGCAPPSSDQPDEVIRDRCEQCIRNYDPCISCSAHFLKLSVHRT